MFSTAFICSSKNVLSLREKKEALCLVTAAHTAGNKLMTAVRNQTKK